MWAAGSATEAVGLPAVLFADAWRVRQKKGIISIVMRPFDEHSASNWPAPRHVACCFMGMELSKGLEMTTRTYTAVLHREEDLYVAECPEVGTVSQGYTVEEAIANLREATELYLEEFPLPRVTQPLFTTFEVAVYA